MKNKIDCQSQCKIQANANSYYLYNAMKLNNCFTKGFQNYAIYLSSDQKRPYFSFNLTHDIAHHWRQQQKKLQHDVIWWHFDLRLCKQTVHAVRIHFSTIKY